MRQERPALVLLDLMMPELDGFGVLEAMQQDADCAIFPSSSLTAQTLTQQDMARLNRGVAAILEKGLFSAQETSGAHRTSLGSEAKPWAAKRSAWCARSWPTSTNTTPNRFREKTWPPRRR